MSALRSVGSLCSVGSLRSVRRYWLHLLTHSPTHHTETLILKPT
ncbi:MAG: hypothetical protein AAGF01_32600 [Cyanobacteria bacterium P01_G01_bin.38]